MSEKIYACLLRLYPAKFRRTHGEDALQLFRDRLRDETGFFRRLRLWLDILVDLALSLPGQYAGAAPAFAVETTARTAGTPFFFVLEEESLGPATLLSGCVLTLAALSLATVLLNQTGTHRSLNFGSTQSQFSSSKSWLTPNATHSHTAAPGPKQAPIYARDRFVTRQEFFPPPIDYLALTNVRRTHGVQRVYVYATPDTSPPSISYAPQPTNTPATSPTAPATFGKTGESPGDNLKVRITLDRARFRMGENMELRLELSNLGDSPLLVPNSASFDHQEGADLELELSDKNGTLSPKTSLVVVDRFAASPNSEKSPYEIALRSFILLCPGTSYIERISLSQHLSAAKYEIRPGRYKLRAYYSSGGLFYPPAYQELGLKEEDVKSIPFQAWHGMSPTNELSFTIVSGKNKE